MPKVFSSCLLHSRPLCWLESVCLPSLLRGSYSLCLGSALTANILSSGSRPGPDLCRIRQLFSQNVAKTLLCIKTLLLRSQHVFPHLFHETRCLIFLFFVRKASNLSPSLSLSLFCLFICSFFTSTSYRLASILSHSLPLCVFPGVYGALSSAASRGLLPPGFR